MFHFFQSIALVSVRIIHLVDRTSSNSSIGTPIWPLRGKDDINFYKFLYFFLVFKFDSYYRILLIEQCSLCMNYCLYKCFDISSDFFFFTCKWTGTCIGKHQIDQWQTSSHVIKCCFVWKFRRTQYLNENPPYDVSCIYNNKLLYKLPDFQQFSSYSLFKNLQPSAIKYFLNH